MGFYYKTREDWSQESLCRPNNIAVDVVANAVFNNLPTDLKDTVKCFRLDTIAAYLIAILEQSSYQDFEGVDNSIPANLKSCNVVEDNPVIRNAIEEILVEFAGFEEEADIILTQVEGISDFYQEMQRTRPLRTLNCAVAMTLGYHIWEIMHRDKRQASELFKPEKSKYTAEQWLEQLSGGSPILSGRRPRPI